MENVTQAHSKPSSMQACMFTAHQLMFHLCTLHVLIVSARSNIYLALSRIHAHVHGSLIHSQHWKERMQSKALWKFIGCKSSLSFRFQTFQACRFPALWNTWEMNINVSSASSTFDDDYLLLSMWPLPLTLRANLNLIQIYHNVIV